MVVAIRVDSSMQIGSGHVMRCLTLAGQLRRVGLDLFFICSELDGNMNDFLEKKGHTVERIPSYEGLHNEAWKFDYEHTKKILDRLNIKIDWLIVDHYGLDARWESRLRSYVKKIMVIDDLANRRHDCDYLLDQNFYLDMDRRYQGLVSSHCAQLLGPKYALLRSEFYEIKKTLRERDGKVGRILIFFGGSDPTNETAKSLEAVRLLNRLEIAIDVVVGISNPYKEYIKGLCDELNATFHCQVDNMAQLMANADLAIGAGGTVTWERCFLGLPSITITVADNQIKVTEDVSQAGATCNLGSSNSISSERIVDIINYYLRRPDEVLLMSNNAIRLSSKENSEGLIGLKLCSI